jgi:hypothetical protein
VRLLTPSHQPKWFLYNNWTSWSDGMLSIWCRDLDMVYEWRFCKVRWGWTPDCYKWFGLSMKRACPWSWCGAFLKWGFLVFDALDWIQVLHGTIVFGTFLCRLLCNYYSLESSQSTCDPLSGIQRLNHFTTEPGSGVAVSLHQLRFLDWSCCMLYYSG